MVWCATFSLVPAVLIAFGALWGGVFPSMALVTLTCGVFIIDRHVPAPDKEGQSADGWWLCCALAVAHAGLLPLVIWACAAPDHLSLKASVTLGIAAGLWFGQVSHANAHDLIHRRDRSLRRLGRWLYASLLYGDHETAHLRVHHVYAATTYDPNTAQRGVGFWAFAVRCFWQEFAAGWHAEGRRRAALTPRHSCLTHPYVQHAAISCASLGVAVAVAG